MDHDQHAFQDDLRKRMKKQTELSKRVLARAGPFLLLVAIGLLAGCASLGPRLGSVRGEKVSAGAVEVTSIQTRANPKGGIVVLGDVRSRWGYSTPTDSHLDVYALDGEGHALANRATRYSPWPIPRARYGYENHAGYCVRLTVNAEAVRTVRVVHHQSALKKCELALKEVH